VGGGTEGARTALLDKTPIGPSKVNCNTPPHQPDRSPRAPTCPRTHTRRSQIAYVRAGWPQSQGCSPTRTVCDHTRTHTHSHTHTHTARCPCTRAHHSSHQTTTEGMRGCHTSGVHVLLWYMKGRVPPTCHYILTTALLLCWPDCCGLHAALLSHHPSRQALMSELNREALFCFTSTHSHPPPSLSPHGASHWATRISVTAMTSATIQPRGSVQCTHPRGAVRTEGRAQPTLEEPKTKNERFVANFPPKPTTMDRVTCRWQLPLSGGLALSATAPP
jgi:hypothetical protein